MAVSITRHGQSPAEHARWSQDDVRATIPERFARQVAATPDAEAIGGERTLSYGQLDALSDRIAAALAQRARAAEHEAPRTALLLGHDRFVIAAALAALKCGSAVVTLNGDDPASRLNQVRSTLAPVMLVTDSRRLDVARAAGFTDAQTVVLADDDDLSSAPVQPRPPTAIPGRSPNAADLAFLICTSGTSGEPKIVMQTHANALHNVLRYTNGLGVRADDRVALLAALSGGQGLASTWATLLNGATLCPFSISERGLSGLTRWLTDNRISILDTIPSVLRSLKRVPDSGPISGVRLVRLASEAGLWSDFDAFAELFADGAALASVLASSEAGVIAQKILTRDARRGDGRLPVGPPAEGIAVELRAPDGSRVDDGEIGELVVVSRYLAPGYWRDDALTRDRFESLDGARRFRTGDLVRRSPDGELTVTGRADRQVKVSGHRLQLEEVEAAIAAHPAVAGAVVLAQTGERDATRLTAYVTGAGERPVDPRELRGWLRERLPSHAIPAAFSELQSFPLNAHGKVDLKQLAEIEPTAGRAPALGSETEELIAGLWQQAFEREVSSHQGFIDLGGDSLQAAEIAAGIQELFGVTLDLRTFLSDPTVAMLTAIVQERQRTGSDDELPPLRCLQRLGPLSFAQARFWEQQRRDTEQTRWNVVVPFALRGELDVEAFSRSVEAVVSRHEILRSTFAELDGRPTAVARGSLPAELSIEDLRGAEDLEQRIEQALQEEMTRPFQLGSGPLLRLRLLRISKRKYRLLRSSHHMIHDPLSWEVFFSELGAHYGALTEGRPSPLGDPPPLQYLDYAVWERECVRDGAARIAAAADWWERQLAQAPPQLELPFTRPTGPQAAAAPQPEPEPDSDQTVLWGIDEAHAAALDRIGREAGCTFQMTRLALFAALLAIEADADDLIVSTPFSMRTRAELQKMIGPFANPARVRLRFTGEPSYRDWLKTVRRAVIDASAHSALPWEPVMGELLRRGLELPRASATFVSWQSALSMRFGGIELQSLPRRWGAADGFRLGANRPYEQDRCWAEFDPSVHDRAGVVDFTTRLALLAAIVANEPDRPLRDLHYAAAVGS